MRGYLIEADFEKAAANGISSTTLRNRFYNLCWDVEKAVTEPVGNRFNTLWNKYKDVAVVSYSSFQRRIKKGMDPYEAATKTGKKRKYTKEDIKIAAENGISERCLKQRIYEYNMPVEVARVRPKHVNRGKGLRKKNYSKTHWNYVKGV